MLQLVLLLFSPLVAKSPLLNWISLHQYRTPSHVFFNILMRQYVFFQPLLLSFATPNLVLVACQQLGCFHKFGVFNRSPDGLHLIQIFKIGHKVGCGFFFCVHNGVQSKPVGYWWLCCLDYIVYLNCYWIDFIIVLSDFSASQNLPSQWSPGTKVRKLAGLENNGALISVPFAPGSSRGISSSQCTNSQFNQSATWPYIGPWTSNTSCSASTSFLFLSRCTMVKW